MKRIGLFFGLVMWAGMSFGQEIKIITVIESIIPGGTGRSRIIEHQEPVDYKAFTTERRDGKDSKQMDVKRKDAKIDSLDETKLLNFFSLGGINFQNVASNDAIISSRLTELVQEGYRIIFVTSGVESNSGRDDKTGLFITRFILQKD